MKTLIKVHQYFNGSQKEMILNVNHITRIEEIKLSDSTTVRCVWLTTGESFFLTETIEQIEKFFN